MGVEFSSALDLDERGTIAAVGLRTFGTEWDSNARKVG